MFHINLIDSHAFFHCSKTNFLKIIIIKQIDIILQQRFGKKFKLILNRIIFGIKYKVGLESIKLLLKLFKRMH